MREMTFEEWVWANHDLLDELRAEIDYAGVCRGTREMLGDQDAADYIYDSLRFEYDKQFEQDRSRLMAYRKLVSGT